MSEIASGERSEFWNHSSDSVEFVPTGVQVLRGSIAKATQVISHPSAGVRVTALEPQHNIVKKLFEATRHAVRLQFHTSSDCLFMIGERFSPNIRISSMTISDHPVSSVRMEIFSMMVIMTWKTPPF